MKPYTVHRGDRIAQMIISPVIQVEFAFSDELTETKRGTGGFGSTDVAGFVNYLGDEPLGLSEPG